MFTKSPHYFKISNLANSAVHRIKSRCAAKIRNHGEGGRGVPAWGGEKGGGVKSWGKYGDKKSKKNSVQRVHDLKTKSADSMKDTQKKTIKDAH